jgi:glycosyltransferase involved in cell wall biosynthesis
VYIGRLEAGKGVPALVEAHQQVVKTFHDAPTLVLAGAGDLVIRGERITVLGRIDEADKWAALRGAMAAVVPSRYESLSLLALEAMAMGTPVLGNDASAVVVGQLSRSRAGLTYTDTDVRTFIDGVRRIGLERAELSKNARRFAQGHHWSTVISAYLDEIEHLARSGDS